jgi:arylsulfatase A-like enzyme
MAAVLWLHIAALCAIAIAQPLFDLLGANPEFFIAHRAAPADVLLLIVALAGVVPALLVLVVRLAGVAGARARDIALSVVLAILVCLIGMQIAVRLGATRWFVGIPVALALGVSVALAYRWWAPVRTFCSALSIAVVVVPAAFLLKPEVRTLLGAGHAGEPGGTVKVAEARGAAATPVVLIIFDEMPLASLLDAHQNIDPVLYPNLTALARDGVWFRNATTVDDFTRWAVPAIVSGKYPRHDAVPSAADHPDTLFTLLNPTHRLEVSETVTGLCPVKLCPRIVETSMPERLAAMESDLQVVYLHLILTPDLTTRLPDPTQTWAGFESGSKPVAAAEDGEGAQAADVADAKAVAAAAQRRWREGIEASRVAPVRGFIDGITAEDPQPSFYFLHTLISHQPHRMLPSGKENKTWTEVPGRTGWNRSQSFAVFQRYQRHLLQVGFVDYLVGQLTRRLKETDLYDRALVIITSDHGISYLPNAPQRTFVSQIAPEIMRVPLVVKFPKETAVTPHVSSVNAESVDILPTVADVLDLDVPWTVDGRSLIDPQRRDRPVKVMFSGSKGRRQNIDPSGLSLDGALARKLETFGDGSANPHRAPRLPPFDQLIGQPLASMKVADGGGRVEIANSVEYEDVDLAAPAVVFDVAGRFDAPHPDAVVALAINGTIEAVTRTWESNPRGWVATPRLNAWRPGRNVLDVFIVERTDAGYLLQRAVPAHVRPADLNLILASAAEEWGVEQGGFYRVEGEAGKEIRWTRDRAEIANLLGHDRPRSVDVGVALVPDGTPKPLKIDANDCVLFEGTVTSGWSSTLPLDRCDISRGGLTLIFTTPAPRRKEDGRRLGVALSHVFLR